MCFSLLVIVVFLAALDGVFYLAGYRTTNTVFIDRTQLRKLDDVYGCSLVPDTDAGKYRINSQGYREDYTIPVAGPETEAVRILAIGDSIVFGSEVENAEAICCQLENRIDAALSEGRSSEVINTAVMWWGPTQYLSRYEREGKRFDPDCVIIGSCPNDVTDVIAMEKLMASDSLIEHKYYLDLVVGRDPMNATNPRTILFYRASTFMLEHSAFANFLYDVFVEREYERLEAERREMLNSMDIFELTNPYMKKMNMLLNAITEPRLFILFPSVNYVNGVYDPVYFPYETYYHDFTKALLMKHEVPCVDVTAVYRDYLADHPEVKAEALFAGDLHHPSALGHSLVADAAYAVLVHHAMIPPFLSRAESQQPGRDPAP